jgi:hypothetical protein
MELVDRILGLGPFLIPIVAIIVGGAIAIVAMVHSHNERIAKIERGIDPDAARRWTGMWLRVGVACFGTFFLVVASFGKYVEFRWHKGGTMPNWIGRAWYCILGIGFIFASVFSK